MNRRNFIVRSCTTCLSASSLTVLLSSCQSTKYITGNLVKDGLMVPVDDFKINQKENTGYRSFIVVRNEALQYPICLYRFNDATYTALWMQCTHQGTELQASGSFLQCSAHGSEFSNEGKVTNGPADRDLRTFPVTVNDHEIFIDLRKP